MNRYPVPNTEDIAACKDKEQELISKYHERLNAEQSLFSASKKEQLKDYLLRREKCRKFHAQLRQFKTTVESNPMLWKRVLNLEMKDFPHLGEHVDYYVPNNINFWDTILVLNLDLIDNTKSVLRDKYADQTDPNQNEEVVTNMGYIKLK
jgi:hypothetical protein